VQLEATVAKRTANVGVTGESLYGRVFAEGGSLTWKGADAAAVAGRRFLFMGAGKAYRNKLAHKVRPKEHQEDRQLILQRESAAASDATTATT
jgi:hypothetical protein